MQIYTTVNIYHTLLQSQKEFTWKPTWEVIFPVFLPAASYRKKNHMLELSDKYLYLYALYKTNQSLSSGWKLAENLDWIEVTLIRQIPLMAKKSTLFTENSPHPVTPPC